MMVKQRGNIPEISFACYYFVLGDETMLGSSIYGLESGAE